MPSRFLLINLAGIMLLCLSIVTFNWLLNPYGFFSPPQNSLNELPKHRFNKDYLLEKQMLLQKSNPDLLILGDSIPYLGLAQESFHQFRQPFNAGLPGLGPYYGYRILQYFPKSIHSRPAILIFLDYTQFQPGYDQSMKQFSQVKDFENRHPYHYLDKKNNIWRGYVMRDILSVLFNQQTLRDSIDTIRQKQKPTTENAYITGFAHKNLDEQHRKHDLSGQQKFDGIRPLFTYQALSISPNDEMEYLKSILDHSYQHGFNVYLIMVPRHVFFLETIFLANMEEAFFQWKQDVVEMNTSLGNQYNRSSDNIWDFTTYNSYSLDQFDWAGNITPVSPYFLDHVHFNTALGDKIIREIFGDSDNAQTIEGFKLSESNFKEMVIDLRKDHEKFQAIYGQLISNSP